MSIMNKEILYSNISIFLSGNQIIHLSLKLLFSENKSVVKCLLYILLVTSSFFLKIDYNLNFI